MSSVNIDKQVLDAIINYLEQNYIDIKTNDRWRKNAFPVMQYGVNPALLLDLQNNIATNHQNITFSDRIFEHMRLKDKTAPYVYKKANIDRKNFSRWLSYQRIVNSPNRESIISICLALELNVEETNEILILANLKPLNNDSRFDLVIKYCIEHEIFENVNEIIDELNKVYPSDQKLPLLP